MRRRLVVPLLATAVAACGGSDRTPSGPSRSTTVTGAATTQVGTTTTRATAAPCGRASPVLVAALELSLTGRARTVVRASAVPVERPPNGAPAPFRDGVVAVAAGFTGPGIRDGTVGFWAVTPRTARTGRGRALAADSVTREFSTLGTKASLASAASRYASAVAATDAGRRARTCAEG